AELWSLPEEPAMALAEYSLGTSYSYLSQTYYVLETSVDQLDSTTKLNEAYLNQPGAFAELTLRPLRDRRWSVNAFAEQSSEYLRGRLQSVFQPRSLARGVSGDFSLEARRRNNGAPEVGDEYTVGRAALKFGAALSQRTAGYLRLRGEFHDLGSADSAQFASAYTNDYAKGGAEIGLDVDFANFDRLSFSAAVERRDVPDQTSLAYTALRFAWEYSGFIESSYYTLALNIDNRDYDPSGDDADQRWFRFDANGKFRLSESWSLVPELSLEAIDYRLDSSTVSLDQTRSVAEVKLSRRWGLTALSLGPRLATLSQEQPPLSRLQAFQYPELEEFSEEYAELAGVVEFEYFKLGLLILTIENTLGHRNLELEDSYQSDYWFNRSTLFSSLEIGQRLRFDVVASVEWEWHSQPSDDNAFYLLNSTLAYTL
ncbi:MAG TPA: hypothetical protein VLB27_03120, partial [candidate division Zixibacteria bacterium]|nr:hypothetical protein [candidate division Zixibacteria bacterium]